ncbi:unnamed protein product [Adineta ricciae]|nr:unnamed protein product [Adineta ricciae]
MNQHKTIEEIHSMLFKEITDISEKASIYHEIGSTKDRRDEYNQIIEFYNESLEIEQQSTPFDEYNVANAYNNISIAYDNLNDYSRLFHYHEKELGIHQQEQCPDLSIFNRSAIYNNISEQP